MRYYDSYSKRFDGMFSCIGNSELPRVSHCLICASVVC